MTFRVDLTTASGETRVACHIANSPSAALRWLAQRMDGNDCIIRPGHKKNSPRVKIAAAVCRDLSQKPCWEVTFNSPAA